MENLYNQYKNTGNWYIYEILLQWILINEGVRDMALLQLLSNRKVIEKKKWGVIEKFLLKNKIPFHRFNNDEFLVIYNPKKISEEEINETGGKKFGKQLGEFYTCASNNYSKKSYRIAITANQHEIFAQMCTKSQVKKNLEKFYDIYLKVMEIFEKYDEKNIFCKMETYAFPREFR